MECPNCGIELDKALQLQQCPVCGTYLDPDSEEDIEWEEEDGDIEEDDDEDDDDEPDYFNRLYAN